MAALLGFLEESHEKNETRVSFITAEKHVTIQQQQWWMLGSNRAIPLDFR